MLRRVWRSFVWLVHGVTGESRYSAYLAHERAVHPLRVPMSEREFWRATYRDQGSSAVGRCC